MLYNKNRISTANIQKTRRLVVYDKLIDNKREKQ